MTKTWKSVRDSEAYKSLSSEERDAARRQYFLDVVAPKVNTDELPDAFKQFDAETAPTFKNKVKELAGDAVDTIGESMGFGGKSPGLADTQTVPGVIDATAQPTPMTWEGINAKTRAEQAARDQARIILLEQERADPSKTPAQLADLERELADTRAKIGVASPATEAPQVDVASTMLKPDAGAFDQLVGEKEKPDWELFDQRGFMPAQADLKKRIDAKQRLDELKAIRARTGANQITAENILTGAQKASDIAAQKVIQAGGDVDAANQAGAQAAADALNHGAVEDSEKAFQRMLESAEQDDTSVASPLVSGFKDVYRAADVATSTSKAGIAKAVASALSDPHEKGMAEKVFGTQMQRAGQQVDRGELWEATQSLLGNIKGFTHFAAGQAGNLTAQIGGGAAGFALGNLPGMFTGSAAVEMTTEYGNQVIGRVSEILSQRGQQATPQAIYDILEENPDIIAKSLVKAAGTTAIDTATTFAGMRIAAGPLRAGIAQAKLELGPSASKMDIVKRGSELAKGQHLAAAAKGMTLDIAGAGASEAIPQQMVDHNVDTAEVIGEMLLEPLFGAPTLAGAAAGQIASDVREQQGVTPTAQIPSNLPPPAPVTPPPSGPLTQSLAAAPIVPAVPPVGAAPTVPTVGTDDGTGLADESVPVDAINAEELLGTPEVERTPESFAAEIADGKTLDTPEDIQYYQNNKDAVEAELNRLAAIGWDEWDEQSTDQATPEGEGLAAQPDQVAAQQGAQQVSATDQAAQEVATAQDTSTPRIALNIQEIKRKNGAIGTQGVSELQVRDVLTHVAGMSIPENATMREMVKAFKDSPEAQQRMRDFTAANPLKGVMLPDGTIHIQDGHHRAFLLDQAGDSTIPSIIKDYAVPSTSGATDGRGNPLQEVPEVVAPSSAVPGADLPGSGDIAVGAGDGTGMVGSSAPDMPVSGSGTDVPVRDAEPGREAVEESVFDKRYPDAKSAENVIKFRKLKDVQVFKDGDGFRIGAKVSNKPAPSDNLIQRIKQLGGINTRYRSDVIGDKAGAPGLFSNTGKGLDDLATELKADGFDIDTDEAGGGVDALTRLIQRAVMGESILSLAGQEKAVQKQLEQEYRSGLKEAIDQEGGTYRKNATTKQLEAMLEELRAKEAMMERESIQGDINLAEDQSDELVSRNVTEAEFMAAMGFTEEEANEINAISEKPVEDVTEGTPEESDGARADQGQDQETGEGSKQEEGLSSDQADAKQEPADAKQQTGTPELELIGQTPEEVAAEERARAEQAKRAKAELDRIEAEAKQKRIDAEIAARQEASAENFVLGQSAEDALAGQGDIFSQPVKPTEKPAAQEKPVSFLTFKQWVEQVWGLSRYKDSYLENNDGNERLAKLSAATGGAADAKVARAKYFAELMALPRDTAISLDVFDALNDAEQRDAQRHFFDLDWRLTDRLVAEGKARVEKVKEQSKPYEDALASVNSEIKRLDEAPKPDTKKVYELRQRADRLAEALRQINNGKEPDGRLLKPATETEQQPATSTETPAGQRKATLEERIASEKASHVLDLDKAQTGWKRIDGANNEAVTLVSYDGKIAVPFLTKDKKSGTASVRMNAEAHAYAIDNPYRAAPIPEGELIAKPLYAEAETPAGQPAATTFDSEAFDKARNATIKESKQAGNTHLDQITPSVETMRGKEIYYAHNPKQRGVVRTVDNYGNVYVHWSDTYSAEKELASEIEETNKSWLKSSKKLPYLRTVRNGKTYVMQSSLGRGDLKDYVIAQKEGENAQTPPQAEAPQDQPSQPQGLPAEVLETPVNATSSVQAEAASGVPVEKQARTMTEDGRASDGKPINPGDTFRTLSGRTTTPYPKQKSEKYASQWLIDNAIEEAKSRGDGFNETAFGGEKVMKGGGIPPASRDSMLMYLFGQQPVVVPSILKPLTASNRNAKPGLTIDDIPPMFLQKLMVKLPVLNTKTNQYQNGEANALEALTETRSDIDKMKALLNCLTA